MNKEHFLFYIIYLSDLQNRRILKQLGTSWTFLITDYILLWTLLAFNEVKLDDFDIVNNDHGSWLDNQDNSDKFGHPDKNFMDFHHYNDWQGYSDRGCFHIDDPWTTKDCHGYNDWHGYSDKGCFHIDNPWTTMMVTS